MPMHPECSLRPASKILTILVDPASPAVDPECPHTSTHDRQDPNRYIFPAFGRRLLPRGASVFPMILIDLPIPPSRSRDHPDLPHDDPDRFLLCSLGARVLPRLIESNMILLVFPSPAYGKHICRCFMRATLRNHVNTGERHLAAETSLRKESSAYGYL